jgi:phage terminase large subunit-like protein
VVAAFAGNRFGKTTALVVRSLIECLGPEWVPDWLQERKRWVPGENTVRAAVHGRIVCETFQHLHSVLLPTFHEWTPPAALKGGGWKNSFNKQLGLLQFANGSFIEFKTYQQEAKDMAGSALHFVGYDEPPPREIREECKMRLTDFRGYEMFAMTPLKANTGWIRREIWRNRESPDITVVKGSIWDNKALARDEIEYQLSTAQSDAWRRAREFGDFVDIGGLIYPDFERRVLPDVLSPAFVSSLDMVVGIDPGIRNAGIVWVGFDADNTGWVVDDVLLQDRTPADYVDAIRQVNARWGVVDPLYVIDPAAAQRSQATGENVDGELMRRGVFASRANNNVEAGCQQVRVRLQFDRLRINPECRGLRAEADDYAAEDREDGVFKPLKGNDHRLDALRYACMARSWDPQAEMV